MLASCDSAILAQEAGSDGAGELATRQLQIQRDYERFEKALLDLAEQARRKDPERAELLFRARGQSQEQRILAEMLSVAELLKGTPKYGDALGRQEDVLTRMQNVLKLLQSLDDRERVGNEIARIEELLKDTNRLLAGEKDLRADTQRGRDADRLTERQKKVLNDARELAEKIEKQDQQRQAAGKPAATDRQQPEDAPAPAKEPTPGEQPGSDDGPAPEKPQSEAAPKPPSGGDAKSPMGDQSGEKSTPMPGEPMPGAPMEGAPMEGEPMSGSPMEGMPPSQTEGMPPSGQQPSGESPQQPPNHGEQPTPGRQELEQARREMQQSLEKLEAQQLDQAGERQAAAIDRLEELKAELEKILRQLREEEKEMYLTLLEARFQNMLRRQEQINAETRRLDAIPAAERSSTFGAKIEVIRRQQLDNELEAEKALNLLKSDGSSVAFPEAVEQMRANMQVVSRRLAQLDTGLTTQLVEQLILETLEEMIFALRQEMEKQDERRQQPQQQQQEMSPEEQGLVNQLAELKMIRSLQNQVNRLTRQLGMEIDGEQAQSTDQLQLIRDLAQRQLRIQEATYDLSVGKNQ
jgi:hypothetical protein